MMPKTKTSSYDAVAQAWKDYEGTVTQARKPYENAIKKEQAKVYRKGDKVAILFRKKKETEE